VAVELALEYSSSCSVTTSTTSSAPPEVTTPRFVRPRGDQTQVFPHASAGAARAVASPPPRARDLVGIARAARLWLRDLRRRYRAVRRMRSRTRGEAHRSGLGPFEHQLGGESMVVATGHPDLFRSLVGPRRLLEHAGRHLLLRRDSAARVVRTRQCRPG